MKACAYQTPFSTLSVTHTSLFHSLPFLETTPLKRSLKQQEQQPNILSMAPTTSKAPPPLVFFLFFSFFILSSKALQVTDILLAFKDSIKDPMNTLSTWSSSSEATHFCNWTGVTCTTSSSPYPTPTSLNLQGLNLSGEISTSICQLPSLSVLNLANNLFNQPIPLHLSQCSSLETLNLSYNLIWGTIPDQISLFKSLKVLDLSKNHVEGRIPDSLGSLKNLQVLNLGSNLFSGSLPSSAFGNLSELLVLDLSENPFLLSEIPIEIGGLVKLQQLLLQRSGFYGQIPDSFVGLKELEVLDLSQNNLTGGVPLGLGLGLKTLISFDVSQNKLSGAFPTSICTSSKTLTYLSLHKNFFTGLVPKSFNQCSNLERFQVQNNGFSGDFPTGLWSLPKIKLVRAENNRFFGEIPHSISVATQLEQVQIDNNSFTGKVPANLGLLKNLYKFSASLNSFYGDIPQNICDSPVMSILNLSQNLLSGRIPELTRCRKLVSLSLANNSLDGNIPNSLAELPVLTYIDLSDNNLTGPIPPELENLKLALLNISFNRLSGKVPPALISGLPASFLEGNPDLCGPGLPNSCIVERRNPDHPTKQTSILISLAFAAGVMAVVVAFFILYRSSKKKSLLGSSNMVLFYPIRMTEHDLMMGINEKTALGSDGKTFGRVHLMKLSSGEYIAVKKLMNTGILSLKSMKAEMKTLAKISNKNVTKLMGFCYLDDVIFLIYEFVQNGSLGDLICKSDLQLEWDVRLQIAVGAAQGLAYLHQDYVPHLLHRNIKSRNVLLDVNYEPKLTDFALDRIVGEQAYQLTVASELGSNCYLAPEHGCSKKATEQMDVYAFGVVLLELVTGRQAEQEESGDPIDVVKWVRRKVNTTNGAIQLLDPKIVKTSQQEMLGALDIALCCTSVMPEKRPTMFEVVRSLKALNTKTNFSATSTNNVEFHSLKSVQPK